MGSPLIVKPVAVWKSLCFSSVLIGNDSPQNVHLTKTTTPPRLFIVVQFSFVGTANTTSMRTHVCTWRSNTSCVAYPRHVSFFSIAKSKL